MQSSVGDLHRLTEWQTPDQRWIEPIELATKKTVMTNASAPIPVLVRQRMERRGR